MNAHVEGRMEGAAARPLSAEQIKSLIHLARQAYAACEAEILFDDWRHGQCLLVAERPGFRQCRNEDFGPLRAHFLRLLGREDEAQAQEVRDATSPRRAAMAELNLAVIDVEHAGFESRHPIKGADYAAGFLRKACKTSLDDASAGQVWRAVYLLRRKAMLLRRAVTAPAEEMAEEAAPDMTLAEISR